MLQTRTVQVKRVSDLATEREIHEFFSFSGEIEHIEIRREAGESRIAFVTFKDPKALEIALLLSGATIVDQVVSIAPAENYISQLEIREVRIVDNAVSMSQENTSPVAEEIASCCFISAMRRSPIKKYAIPGKMSPNNGRVYISKAQDVVSSMLAKGSAIKQDAVNKAKAFDEKHRWTANASSRVTSFDQRVGLTEKLTVGISAVNSKVKSVDQRFQVSDKTMSALMAAERKLNDTGSAVKSSRYVAAGTAWLNGAFNKVAKAGQVAGVKTREKWNLAFSNLVAKLDTLNRSHLVSKGFSYCCLNQDPSFLPFLLSLSSSSVACLISSQSKIVFAVRLRCSSESLIW
ncbi:Binding partner of ACD11 1 [Sesamum angolense]|uniref:Binding partner of ACD11 1 n=1 Tax=Sesamum angolense TaxID=2727404 RepID=A0AAE1WES7_9LAMI|nr:Binding partner of ACD11 1 [Sesamum angolense]